LLDQQRRARLISERLRDPAEASADMAELRRLHMEID